MLPQIAAKNIILVGFKNIVILVTVDKKKHLANMSYMRHILAHVAFSNYPAHTVAGLYKHYSNEAVLT